VRIGDLHLHPVSDGTFRARPPYFGDHVTDPAFFNSILIHTGDPTVLVDAGLGQELQALPAHLRLVGGQLLTGLTDIVCTHLHSDHVGWLFDRTATPTFPRATIWFGAADWPLFVTGPGEMRPHIRAGFLSPTARLRPIDHDTPIAPGVTALTTPGHTPGHLCVELSSGNERALLLGDAITCPIQLTEPSWHSLGDVDPPLAARTRDRLWHELSDGHTIATGAHFPELRLGRVQPAPPQRWI
jgi:glyoxylase-like metal-dependent hydrolase (beta-lactamase superfamily II)